MTTSDGWGRVGKTTNGIYHDRIIDILLCDDVHIHTDRLTLPHPLMYGREFVMKPLQEIMVNGGLS